MVTQEALDEDSWCPLNSQCRGIVHQVARLLRLASTDPGVGCENLPNDDSFSTTVSGGIHRSRV